VGLQYFRDAAVGGSSRDRKFLPSTPELACYPLTTIIRFPWGSYLQAMKQVLSSERFLENVANSGLVDATALVNLEERVREHLSGRLPKDPEKIAKLLVKKRLLTEWHVEKLLSGKYKGFFLGKYKLLGHIGTGGMSSVYLAEHTRMGDKRAIKVLPKSRVKDATYLARFQLEAKAIASLHHPNIVLAHDLDNDGDVHYIVMEYVDGVDMQQMVKQDGPLELGVAAEMVAQAARGLHHAHGKGVIHRDVKPANLLIDKTGRVRLLDMGLALVDAEDEQSLTVANNENVLGTADYLAPEQALNSHSVDHRADIYGLGCTLYYLLTGKPPFSDGTLAQRIARHQKEMPKSIRTIRTDCSGELEGICVKMIQKDPRYRYQNAEEVAIALERYAATAPKPIGAGARSGMTYDHLESGSSSISLDELRDSTAGHGDTLSSRVDDTLSSSGNILDREIFELTSNQSGRLVSVIPRPDLMDGSFIDLQVESGFQGDAQTVGGTAQGSPSGGERQDHHTASSNNISPITSGRRRGFDPMLIGALVIALFIVAVALGFMLARVVG